jgi:hypothetical protein
VLVIKLIGKPEANRPGEFQVGVDASQQDKAFAVTPRYDNPKAVVLTGKTSGVGKLTVEDQDGNLEVWEVAVRVQVLVPERGHRIVTLPDKKAVRQVKVEDEQLLAVEMAAGQATSVKVSGKRVGDSRFEVMAADGSIHSYEVKVRSLDAPAKDTLILCPDATLQVYGKSGKRVSEVTSSHGQAVRVSPLFDDTTGVHITALSPGISRLSLTDSDNVTTSYEVIVREAGPFPPRRVTVAPGAESRVPTSRKKDVKEFQTYAIVSGGQFPRSQKSPVDVKQDPKDATALLVTGKSTGTSHIYLTDADGRTEIVAVEVGKSGR